MSNEMPDPVWGSSPEGAGPGWEDAREWDEVFAEGATNIPDGIGRREPTPERALELMHTLAQWEADRHAPIMVVSDRSGDFVERCYLAPGPDQMGQLNALLAALEAGPGLMCEHESFDESLPGRYQGFLLLDPARLRQVVAGESATHPAARTPASEPETALVSYRVRGEAVRVSRPGAMPMEYPDPGAQIETHLLELARASGMGELLTRWGAPV